MNIENVNKAIAVMERVKERGDKFDLCVWQSCNGAPAAEKEEELHTCGTAACFAGWVAVSPEFQKGGGGVEIDGSPSWKEGGELFGGSQAIEKWLDTPMLEAQHLCGVGNSELVYVETREEVTVDQVLAALYRLRDTGTVYIKETAQ